MEMRETLQHLRRKLTEELNAVEVVARLLGDNASAEVVINVDQIGGVPEAAVPSAKRKYTRRGAPAVPGPDRQSLIASVVRLNRSHAEPTEGPKVTVHARIVAAVKVKPMTSSEIWDFLRGKGWYTGEIDRIYQACSVLKGSGVLESFQDDEHDGQRRYRIPAANA